MTSASQRKPGRRSLLNAELQRKICGLLADGNTIRTVVDAVGIGERTYFEWCERYPHFSRATTRARATAKIKLVKIITAAATVDARHAEWLLERSHPQEYGRSWRDSELHTSPVAAPIINVIYRTDKRTEAAKKVMIESIREMENPPPNMVEALRRSCRKSDRLVEKPGPEGVVDDDDGGAEESFADFQRRERR